MRRTFACLFAVAAMSLNIVSAVRIAVVIPESIIRRSAPDPAAETELGRALVRAEHTLVVLSPEDYQRVAQSAKMAAGNDAPLNQELLTKYSLDYLLVGEAFSEENTTVLPELRSVGMTSFTARLEYHLMLLKENRIALTDGLESSSYGIAPLVAGKRALQRVAQKASIDILSYLIVK